MTPMVASSDKAMASIFYPFVSLDIEDLVTSLNVEHLKSSEIAFSLPPPPPKLYCILM